MANVRWGRIPDDDDIIIKFTVLNPHENLGLSTTGKAEIVAKETSTILPERLGFTFNTYRPFNSMNRRFSKQCSVSIRDNVITVKIPRNQPAYRESPRSSSIAHFQHSFYGSIAQCSFYYRK